MTSPQAYMRRYLDAKSVITLALVLCAFPTYLTITVIGAVGRPIILVGLAMFAWWVVHRLQRPHGVIGESQPLRLLMVLVVLSALASYVSAMFRGLPAEEVSPADTGLLRMAGWLGLFLVASDGLRTWEDLTTVVRRFTWAGAFMATLGLLQFLTKNSLLEWLAVPGMTGDGIGGIDQRGGFVRAAGTAAHPLEYAVVLCTTLPLALALAMEDRRRSALARWAPPTAIAAAAVLSVSRSALLSLFAGMAVLFCSWTPRQRIFAAAGAGALFGTLYVAVPGMAGTVLGMFTGFAADPSVASRVNSYEVAFGMLSRLPWFGRGFGTLLPRYVFLDNQYLGTVIELGIIGFSTILVLLCAGIVTPWIVRNRSSNRVQAQLGAAISAAVCAAATSFAFFDALSFPLSAAFTFLMLGLSNAYRRLCRSNAVGGGNERTSDDRPGHGPTGRSDAQMTPLHSPTRDVSDPEE